MAIALGDPEHGYYRNRDPLGSAGDFITAPEISQVFGELIGLWCAATWQAIGGHDPVRLVEPGPGRGTLMADAMRAARQVPAFAAAAEIHLVETSPTLRQRQREALTEFAPTWHESFEAVPDGPCFVIANEFFDALPVEQFVRTEAGWRRRGVGIDATSDDLCFVLTDDGPSPPTSFQNAPLGVPCEVRPTAEALAGEIAGRIARHGGAALIVDYGHVARAPGDTLQAVRKHRFDDILAQPGLADLTAHVDFAALADSIRAAGACPHGPVSQSEFLNRLGIGARMRALADAAPAQADTIRAGCHRLTDPNQMGQLFKVLAITPPEYAPPAGFETEGALTC
jgi:NADH dehydrogenase [ubiquinone] 1 alpha subcomplex assembly factor 7